VFAFVNNNYQGSANRSQTYDLNATAPNGQNWFGIQAGHMYNIVNLIATNPATEIWSPDRSGSDLINNGIFVWLNGGQFSGEQAQYLKLIDKTEAAPDTDGDGLKDSVDPDDDNDGLPDWWEIANGLNPLNATGNDGPAGDKDGDGQTNEAEYLARTHPGNSSSVFKITAISQASGETEVEWAAIPGLNYAVDSRPSLIASNWQEIYFGTALDPLEAVIETTGTTTQRIYRIRLVP